MAPNNKPQPFNFASASPRNNLGTWGMPQNVPNSTALPPLDGIKPLGFGQPAQTNA